MYIYRQPHTLIIIIIIIAQIIINYTNIVLSTTLYSTYIHTTYYIPNTHNTLCNEMEWGKLTHFPLHTLYIKIRKDKKDEDEEEEEEFPSVKADHSYLVHPSIVHPSLFQFLFIIHFPLLISSLSLCRPKHLNLFLIPLLKTSQPSIHPYIHVHPLNLKALLLLYSFLHYHTHFHK